MFLWRNMADYPKITPITFLSGALALATLVLSGVGIVATLHYCT